MEEGRAQKDLGEKCLSILSFFSEIIMAKPKVLLLLILRIQIHIWLSGILWTVIWVLNWDKLAILTVKPMYYLNENCHCITSFFQCFTWVANVFIFYCHYKMPSNTKLQTSREQGNYLLSCNNAFIIFALAVTVY